LEGAAEWTATGLVACFSQSKTGWAHVQGFDPSTFLPTRGREVRHCAVRVSVTLCVLNAVVAGAVPAWWTLAEKSLRVL